MSPARASSIARPMAFSRSGSIMYLPRVFCRPTTMSLMIFSGSSLLGLSLDKIVRSLRRPPTSPITGRLSDLTILSSDNPKSEDPLKIISDIVVGLQKTRGKYMIEPDREKAIGLAIDEARAGDILLLAGKGHENYQILADRTLEFDDREVALRALRERGYDRPESGPGFGT